VIRVVARRIERTLILLGVRAKITRLPVAIDLTAFTKQPVIPQREAGKTVFRVLSVGRFVPQKNFPLMIESFVSAHQINPTLRLTIVGQGSQKTEIEELLKKKYGRSDQTDVPIIIEQWSSDIPALMRQSDAYLLTSNYEGWARVLIESVVSDLPIITTDVGCVGEVVKHDEHGIVVPVGNKQALVDALVRMSTDQAFYARCKDNLRRIDKRSLPGADFTQYGEKWLSSLQ
jgi:glycosyltransferase involved in cell wall biosynthesis